MFGRSSRLEVEISGDAGSAVRAARDTERAYRGVGNSLGNVSAASGKARSATGGLTGALGKLAKLSVAGFGLQKAAGGMYELFTAASDAAEATTAAAEVFGTGFDQIAAAAENSARAVGLSSTEYIDAAKTFGVFGSAAGLANTELAGFSQEMITAAADMASFHNAAPTDAIAAIGAGLRGEAEPLRQFGILLDDATLRAEALKMGLISTTSEALTPQNKVLAAQQVILGQLGAAQGDWERTSGSAANQQRILTANVKDLAAQLGTNLLPAGQSILTWLNQAVEGFSGLASGANSSVQPMSASAAAAGLLTGKVEPLSAAVALGKAAVDAFRSSMESKARTVRNIVSPALDGLRSAADKVREALARNPEVARALQAAFTNLKTVFSALQGATEGLSSVVGPVLGSALSAAGSAVSGLIDFAGSLIRAWNAAAAAIRVAVASIRAAVSSAASAVRSVPLIGRFLGSAGPVLTTAAAGAPAGRLATANAGGWLAPLSGLASSGSSGGARMVTVVNRITVNGALDPVAVADQLRGIVSGDVRRTGRPWPVTP